MGIGGHALKDDIAFHLSNQASANTTTEESFEANHASESEQLAALGAYIPEENTTSPSHLAPERSPRPLERPERIDEQHSISEFEEPVDLFDFIINQEAERLGIDPEEFMPAVERLLNFFADVESDWDLQAENPESSARGLYQFLTADHTPGEQDGSIHTAIHRLLAVLARHQVEDASIDSPELGWAQYLYDDPEEILHTPVVPQQMLVLANLFQSLGTDPLLRDLTSDDPEMARRAAIELYNRIHHTDPDKNTRANVERKIDHHYPLPDQQYAQAE